MASSFASVPYLKFDESLANRSNQKISPSPLFQRGVKLLRRKFPLWQRGIKGDLRKVIGIHIVKLLKQTSRPGITSRSTSTRRFDSVGCPSTACRAYYNPL